MRTLSDDCVIRCDRIEPKISLSVHTECGFILCRTVSAPIALMLQSTPSEASKCRCFCPLLEALASGGRAAFRPTEARSLIVDVTIVGC